MSLGDIRNIGSLGPEGSFSHEFAKARFPDCDYRLDANDFAEVIALLKSEDVDLAVVPFLNSNGVDVRPAQAAIAAAREWIWVAGCHPHEVIHNLVVADGFKSLKRVVSKEQVFPQCTNWLSQWGDIEQVSASSTSAALEQLLAASAKEREHTGVICNRLAVDLYGGSILYPDIQNPGNVTLFLVLGRGKEHPPTQEALVCLTCPTEECYENTINDFARAGMPLKFTSLKGEFTEELPCFLQFEVGDRHQRLGALLDQPHRTLVGGFPPNDSLAACVAGFFDVNY